MKFRTVPIIDSKSPNNTKNFLPFQSLKGTTVNIPKKEPKNIAD